MWSGGTHFIHLVNKQLLNASHGHRGRRGKTDFLALEPPVFQGERFITTGENIMAIQCGMASPKMRVIHRKERKKAPEEVISMQRLLERVGVNQGRGGQSLLLGLWSCGQGDDGAWYVQGHTCNPTLGYRKCPPHRQILGFPGGSDGKESACNAGDLSLIPGLGRFPREGNGYVLQYSCLENPMERGAWRATVHGVKKSWT